jgi:hypothetical protein
MNRRFLALTVLTAVLSLTAFSYAWAQMPAQPPKESKEQQPQEGKTTKEVRPRHPSYADLQTGMQPMEGFIKLYRKESRLLGELAPGDLNRDILVAIAIARGIGQQPLLGGMTWGFGDNWIWQFRKVEDRIQVVRRNVRFRAAGGTPLARAVHLSYTDSILFSLPIVTTSPNGSMVVDLTPVFMSDLPQISHILRGFVLAPDRSTWSHVKVFRDNVEIEVAATYASSGAQDIETVADSRGVTLYIHYSVSRLPETGYQPRVADDRVGHFITAIRDFSKSGAEDQFVRYVNRWDLRKAEPTAAVSPPVKPIIFWIEKTVPYKYRAAVREGILEWNKAYERAGFSNAIEVRQQPDDATWDPEDINYNTFRWITSGMGFAMGPSRMNPLTGQLLDADVIFDAEFVERWIDTFEVERRPRPAGIDGRLGTLSDALAGHMPQQGDTCCDYAQGMGEQLALGSIALVARGGHRPLPKSRIEQLLIEGVKSVATHEVGHTLGLRHNFKSSTLWTMDELNDPEKTKNVGLTASIMDYMPVNISPKGKRQGDYFSRTIGPYDYWAIEYAYKPLPGGTEGEVAELAKIAARGAADPVLQFATDEDAPPMSHKHKSDGNILAPDPLVNRFDLGKDLVEFARWRLELFRQLLPDLAERVVEPGEGYYRARQAFGLLMRDHQRCTECVARYIGGVYLNRNHKGDPGERPPQVVVEVAKQREALALLGREVLGPEAFPIPAKLYNYLAGSHWHHWGVKESPRPDFPVREAIVGTQEGVLDQVLSPATLARLADSELKTAGEQDVFTAGELLRGLSAAVFHETESLAKAPEKAAQFSDRKPAVNGLRRDLQRCYFDRLAALAMGQSDVPNDCQAIAAAEMETLESQIKQALKVNGPALDAATRSHFNELASRIRKVLEARLNLPRP